MKDKETTLEEIKNIAIHFRDERDWKQFHTPKDLAIDIAVEAGELLEHFRFRTNEDVVGLLDNPKTKKEMSA